MRKYTIQLPCLELLAPSGIFNDQVALKEFALSHWKEEILRRLIVELPTCPATIENGDCSSHSTFSRVSYDHEEKVQATVATDEPTESSISRIDSPQLHENMLGTQGTISSPNFSLPKKLELLNSIARVQRQFFYSESRKVVFGTLLDALLDLLDCDYGFIGEIKVNETTGKQYLHNHAITNIAWDNGTRQFYNDNVAAGLVFTNLHSLFGKVITTSRPVISNDPKSDKRGCGVPPGHPPLDHFLGIPFFMPGGGLNGMVGVSNKPGGFSEDDIEFLEPFTVTCGNLIHAYNQISENKYLIDTLEDSVKKRTRELENANAELAEANRFVLHASKMQLQHFACMSHEIRTPLNCVVGMTSVLRESKLTTMQKEAVEMIVSSGDLLLAIVNDVLDYSKYETEDVNIHVQFNNIQDTITLVLNSIVSKAHPTQSIRSYFDPLIPEHISTDTRRLQQILFNLLGNAVKFSPVDGIIKLSMEMVTEHSNDEGVIKSCEERKMIRFVVEDNGKGIDEADLKRIFQPFQQASSNAENVYGGTGLGLSITQKIVTALDGTISVASKKGEWSKFTVDIPFHDTPMVIEDLSQQVKNYVVHIVGLSEVEKNTAERILKTFNIDGSFFDSFGDMLNTIGTATLPTDQTHVCLLNEDLYDKTKVSALSRSILITSGPKFGVKDDAVDFHIRSLEHLLPSYFINLLLRCVHDKKQQKTVATNGEVTSSSGGDKVRPYSAMKVLIAEDNLVNQKVLTRILNRLSIENVDVVENGLEACKKEEQVEYDIIFMDQQMPVMGGVTACREILGRYSNMNVRHRRPPSIVFVTAHVSEAFEMDCIEAGGSGFIPKPFNVGSIENSLLSVYNQRQNEAGQ